MLPRIWLKTCKYLDKVIVGFSFDVEIVSSDKYVALLEKFIKIPIGQYIIQKLFCCTVAYMLEKNLPPAHHESGGDKIFINKTNYSQGLAHHRGADVAAHFKNKMKFLSNKDIIS